MSVQRAVNGRNFIVEVRKPDDTFVGLFQIDSYLQVRPPQNHPRIIPEPPQSHLESSRT
jgi:hypothetical protein